MSPAPIVEQHVARPGSACQIFDRRLDRRHPRGQPPAIRQGVDDQLGAHAGHLLLARGVELGDGDVVRAGESGRELRGKVSRARIQVRLKEHAKAAARIELARGLDRRGHLGRMVGVVVDDRHAGDLDAPRTGVRFP